MANRGTTCWENWRGLVEEIGSDLGDDKSSGKVD